MQKILLISCLLVWGWVGTTTPAPGQEDHGAVLAAVGHLLGCGAAVDYEEGQAVLLSYVERRSETAALAAAVFFDLGLAGFTRDHDRAVRLARPILVERPEGAKPSSPLEGALVGFCKATSLGSRSDIQKGLAMMEQAAAAGSVEAMYLLGYCYSPHCKTPRMPRDEATSFMWTEKAAQADCAAAMFNLSICFIQGWGTPRDEAVFMKWSARAASKGIPDAIAQLGYAYAAGIGVEKDPVRAVELMMVSLRMPLLPANRSTVEKNLRKVKRRAARPDRSDEDWIAAGTEFLQQEREKK